jgi:hypothetical protein
MGKPVRQPSAIEPGKEGWPGSAIENTAHLSAQPRTDGAEVVSMEKATAAQQQRTCCCPHAVHAEQCRWPAKTPWQSQSRCHLTRPHACTTKGAHQRSTHAHNTHTTHTDSQNHTHVYTCTCTRTCTFTHAQPHAQPHAQEHTRADALRVARGSTMTGAFPNCCQRKARMGTTRGSHRLDLGRPIPAHPYLMSTSSGTSRVTASSSGADMVLDATDI